jgi:hypothetical protein
MGFFYFFIKESKTGGYSKIKEPSHCLDQTWPKVGSPKNGREGYIHINKLGRFHPLNKASQTCWPSQ